MEKSTPHCKLSLIKTMIRAGKVRTTRTAPEGATRLGLNFDGMLAVIQALSSSDFYKSMTTHEDHRVWQDVYRPSTFVGQL